MENPLSKSVAVVVPAFNHARFVTAAIQSALAQTVSVAEVIVVDDGSTDGTAEAVRQIDHPKLRLISQANAGPSAARNRGWRSASAEWIQFLDADDLLPPNAIHDLLATANRLPGTLPYGREAVYPEQVSGAPSLVASMSERDGDLLADIALWYRGTVFSTLVPRALLEEIGGHNDATRYGEDYDFALALARCRTFSFTGTTTYIARMHGTNRHRTFGANAEGQYFATLRRRLNGSLGSSLWWLRRRATAHRAWDFGSRRLCAGDVSAARRLFLYALGNNPAKLGAWKGLLQTIRRNAG